VHPGPVEFDHVLVGDLSMGDWVLLRPGERIPRHSVLIEVAPDRDDTHVHWCAVKTEASNRELCAPGGVLSAGESIEGQSVIVEIRRPASPWWSHPWKTPAFHGLPGLGRHIALLVVLLVTIGATGAGIVGDQPLHLGGDDQSDEKRSGITYQVVAPNNPFGETDAEPDFELDPAGVGWDSGETGPGYNGTDPSGDAVPGSTWTDHLSLTNTGGVPGEIVLRNVSFVSSENGLTDSEMAVNDTGGDPGLGAGELVDALEVRVSAIDQNDTRTYRFGGKDTYRSVRGLDDEPIPVATLEPNETVQFVVEYRISSTVGNEIQSDGLQIDFGFAIFEAG
jgi:hypothetical protein